MSYKGKMASKRGGGKSGNPFERLMQEQCNKPVAAKSAGIVGKWGATSFTSLRAAGDRPAAAPKPKKFFKSRGENSENKESVAPVVPSRAPVDQKPSIIPHKKKEKMIGSSTSSLEKKGGGGGRGGWSPSHRPPLERSPLHPSPPTSNPSTTPPRTRALPSKSVHSQEEDSYLKVKKHKTDAFDTLLSSKPEDDEKKTRERGELKREFKADEKRRGDEVRERENKKRRTDSSAAEPGEPGNHPPRIKLKISLNKSPDTLDNTYKVIRSKDDDLLSVCSQSSTGSENPSDTGSDRTDLSNGHSPSKSSSRVLNPYYTGDSGHPPSSKLRENSGSRPRDKPVSRGKPSRLPRGDQNSEDDLSSHEDIPALKAKSPTAVPSSPPPLPTRKGRKGKAGSGTELSQPVPESSDHPSSNVRTGLTEEEKEESAVCDTFENLPRRIKQLSTELNEEGDEPTEPVQKRRPARDTRREKSESPESEEASGILPGKRKTRRERRASASSASDQLISSDPPEPFKKVQAPKKLPNKTRKNNATSVLPSLPEQKSPSPDPEIDFPKIKTPTGSPTTLMTGSGGQVAPRALTTRSPSPDFEFDFPKRKAAKSEVKPPTTYKKTIFKSRSKLSTAEKPSEKQPAAVTADVGPPRVPPVSEHFVDVSLPHIKSNETDSLKSNSLQAAVKPSCEEENSVRSTRSTRNMGKARGPSPRLESTTKKPEKDEPSSQGFDTEPMDDPIVSEGPGSSQETSSTLSEEPSSSDDLPTRSLREISHSDPTLEMDLDFPARLPERKKTESKPSKGGPPKKTFFKSKTKGTGKALSLYKHNVGWDGDFKHPGTIKPDKHSEEKSEFDIDSEFDSDGNEPTISSSDISFAPSKLTRVATYPTTDTCLDDEGELVTQIKCPKSYKPLFTVIKKVKKAHEINDYGENQEFHDDVEYIVDGLNTRHAISLRCLTAISLASKCMKPNFRMHLRAHSVVTRFFAELQDAPDNPSLALCTSTVLFVLSQDRLNMDMDRDSLKLMLNLLDTDCKISSALDGTGLDKKELEKNKQKVIDICAEMKKMGHANSLNLDLISADHLSMETLLSMTSKRAGEWFKEELRELGGLGHLARTFSDCVNYLTIKPITSWTDTLTDKLKKANRILRVLENISNENEENCNFLIAYKVDDQEFIGILQKLFELLDTEVQLNPTTDNSDKECVGVVIRDTLFSTIRVHVNIVHDYKREAYGSRIIGQQTGMIGRTLRCLFIIPFWFVPLSKRFECLVLALALLINLVENSVENRQSLMDSMAAQKEIGFCVKEEPRLAIEDLVQMYLDREELAKLSEQKTDNILDAVEEEVQEIDPKEEERKNERGKDTLEETVQKLINKAGSHMESSIIAAYIGLVIGYLTLDSDDYECRIREYLPSKDFKTMVVVLKKLNNFMEMTSNGSSHSTKNIKGTQKIITYLEKLDEEPEDPEEDEEESALDFSFDTTKDSITLNDGPDFASMEFGSMEDFGKL